MAEKTVVLHNMLNQSLHLLSYYPDITTAEDQAIAIMETLPFKWCRADWTDGVFEYGQHPEVGSAMRIYVRFFETSKPPTCDCGERAVFETRAGYFCKTCFYKGADND